MLIRKNDMRVAFLQHADLTKRYIALSIRTMQDHEETQSIGPEQSDGPFKGHTMNGYSGFATSRSILQSLPMGVVTFDSDLRIVEANSQAAKLIKLGDYIDKSLAEGTESPEAAGPNWTEQLKSAISAGKTHRFDTTGSTANGNTRLLQLVCIPIRSAKSQKCSGGCILIEDMSERVNIQRQLANTERLATVGKLASKVAHELNDLMDGTPAIHQPGDKNR